MCCLQTNGVTEHDIDCTKVYQIPEDLCTASKEEYGKEDESIDKYASEIQVNLARLSIADKSRVGICASGGEDVYAGSNDRANEVGMMEIGL